MKKINIFLPIIVLLFSCENSKESKKDTVKEVVHDIENWDRFVIPLALPYEIVNNQQEKNTWLINMFDKRKRFQFSITPVEKVAVYEKFIFVKGGGMYGKTSFYGKMVNNVSFVIIPESKTEIGFEDSLKFNQYIDSLKIKNIQWYDVNNLFEYYKTNKKMPFPR